MNQISCAHTHRYTHTHTQAQMQAHMFTHTHFISAVLLPPSVHPFRPLPYKDMDRMFVLDDQFYQISLSQSHKHFYVYLHLTNFLFLVLPWHNDTMHTNTYRMHLFFWITIWCPLPQSLSAVSVRVKGQWQTARCMLGQLEGVTLLNKRCHCGL